MEKRLNKRKYLVISLAAVAVVAVAIVVGIVSSSGPVLNDDYFVSDGTKLVMSLTPEMAAFEDDANEPDVTHIVYYYNDGKVTDAKVYYEYRTEDLARTAYSNIDMKNRDWTTTRRLSGKYIVFNALKAKYDGMTTEQVQRNIDDMRAAGGLAK